MLMDEPTSSLDGDATAVLEGLARDLVADGTPVVWVTHSHEQLRRLADHVLLLEDGRVARSGSADEVLGRMNGDVDALGLAASLVLVAIALAISWRMRLRLSREMVVSCVRGFVQLMIVGAALAIVIDPDTSLVWSWLWVAGIVVFAATIVRRRAPAVPGLFWIALVANGATAVIGFAVTFGLGIFPVEGRTLVPIAGMLVGNAMKSAIVGAERTVEALSEGRAEIEARLALGQPWTAASRPIVRGVLRTALSPQIENTKGLGIVFLRAR